jgi:hypothetical protein
VPIHEVDFSSRDDIQHIKLLHHECNPLWLQLLQNEFDDFVLLEHLSLQVEVFELF